jgi:hexosaminidase
MAMATVMATSAPVTVGWECVANSETGESFAALLTVQNVSGRPLAAGWALYFNTCRQVVIGSVDAAFSIEHVNGDLFRLTQPGAGAWQAGGVHVVGYRAQFWAISITDAPLGFYLAPGDGGPAADLGDPRIVPFTRPEQLRRRREDSVPVLDAAARFRQNAAARLLPLELVGRITPQPLSAVFPGGDCVLARDTDIIYDSSLAGEAAYLRALLAGLPGLRAEGGATIVLEPGAAGGDEAYVLEVETATVRVRGGSPHGVFNGIQTLAQLLDATGTAPFGRVVDAPRFGYRGMMLDVARHFAGVDTVLRLLDCMARYKLNRFHFHLTDDEGWRLEIAGLPELTEVGARRGVSPDGQPCLPPAFGSGACIATSAGTGFYSADEFIAILRHAHARHIEVIPEFNMPGHARAAVVAMRVRHDRLRALGDIAGAEQYLLSDPDDASVYQSVQLWRDNVICIALPSSDRFIDTVVGAVCALFRAAGAPLRAIHTGGDEVPAGAWLGSPLCRQRMARHGWTDVGQLRDDFVGRCRAILARHGLGFAGWEETVPAGAVDVLVGDSPAVPGFQVYVWNNAWGSGLEDSAYRLANAGYSVVLANAAHLYFDLACAKDPEEPGYYWGGFVGTRNAFTFCPLDATLTAGTGAMGQPLEAPALAAMQRLDTGGRARIAGLQGQLWSENTPSRERLEYMVAPRLLALAERAWASDPGWQLIVDPGQRAQRIERDWNEFANRLGQRDLPRLDSAPLAYGYRLPPPGVVEGADGDAKTIHANVVLPGLALHYTVDGSEPAPASARYREPVAATGLAVFRIASFDTRGRKSRTVTFDLDLDLNLQPDRHE